jgi:hypothetical protein
MIICLLPCTPDVTCDNKHACLESLLFLLGYVTCDIFNSEVTGPVHLRRSRVVAVIGKGSGTTATRRGLGSTVLSVMSYSSS